MRTLSGSPSAPFLLFIAAFTATNIESHEYGMCHVFQSAFHRGIHCYQYRTHSAPRGYDLSVRFSSRHSLLLACVRRVLVPFGLFQSAFHRGIGCYCHLSRYKDTEGYLSVPFSSGHRLLLSLIIDNNNQQALLSVPFSSGHRLLPLTCRLPQGVTLSFSPLFIGA